MNSLSKNKSIVIYVVIFILAQIAWIGLLGLWIYFYVSNYLIITKVGDQLSPQITIDTPNALVFSGGIVLILAIAAGIAILFRNLGAQIRINRMYDNFIGNITHELKSPLASINLYLQTLRDRDVPKQKRDEFLENMLNDTNRLQKLIDSILKISALEQKKIAHNFELYSAGKVLGKLFEESRRQFKLSDSQFIVSGCADSQIMIDEYAFKIIVDNLVDNAVKYSSDELKINIRIEEVGKRIKIIFSDYGIGIPESERKNIFKKFYRIYRKDIPNVKGTGLGLYWVNEIVKLHGGNINLSNKEIKKGTEFVIDLPVFRGRKNLKASKKNNFISMNDEN